MRLRAAVLATSAALAAACATVPADAPAYRRAPEPAAGMANVYVYRSETRGSCHNFGAPTMFVDGHAIYELVTGAYTVVALPAGKHKIKLTWGSSTAPELEFYFTADDGQSQYLRLSDSYCPGQSPPGAAVALVRANAEQIPEGLAEPELGRCCRFMASNKLPANISPQQTLINGR